MSDLMGQSFLSGDENVLELGRLVVTHTECAKCYRSVQGKTVKVM